ncbi:hypothetical protein METEAL_07200 [Mesoterricola silvestris]|uniref:Uncharacterized protein n=2 Tax=Mesoterricola silvestris TaxID=2927979 RepID=A0AA48GFB5_9BACT|nr:hypothetical protein METEAL_07200 [Mesoterricola silvestris]
MLNGTVKGGVVNNGGEISITGTVHGVVVKKAGTTVIQSCAVIKP